MYAIWLMEYIAVLLSVIVCVFNASYLVHTWVNAADYYLFYSCNIIDAHMQIIIWDLRMVFTTVQSIPEEWKLW